MYTNVHNNIIQKSQKSGNNTNIYQLMNGSKCGISIQWSIIWPKKKKKKKWSTDTHIATRVNLENFVLSERSQPQRPIIVWFHLCEMFRIGKSIETQRLKEAGRRKKRDWQLSGVSVQGDENVLELNTCDVSHPCEHTKIHWALF